MIWNFWSIVAMPTPRAIVGGDDLYARIENLPLDGLRLPPGGVDGIGTVSGTIDSATIQANLRDPSFRTTFDIIDPGIGYISLQTVEVESPVAAEDDDDTPPSPAPTVPPSGP